MGSAEIPGARHQRIQRRSRRQAGGRRYPPRNPGGAQAQVTGSAGRPDPGDNAGAVTVPEVSRLQSLAVSDGDRRRKLLVARLVTVLVLLSIPSLLAVLYFVER